jgi:NAD(P)-dependent dehydrogenase (short-subunit alcohol dehydrogenase family)
LQARNLSTTLAWGRGAAVSQAEFLHHANCLARSCCLSAPRFAFNLCEDRYLFLIAGHITVREFDHEAIKQLVPMKRAGKPEEVAALVSFLASEAAGYISGQVISINGAMA